MRTECRRHMVAYPGIQTGTIVVLAFGWLTLTRVLFASKFTCRLLFRVGYLGSRRQESITSWNQVIFPDKWLGIKNSQGNPNCDWKQQQLIWLGERSQDGSSGRRSSILSIYILGKAISLRSGRLTSSTLPVHPRSCEDFRKITPIHPQHSQVFPRHESTKKSATRPTDGYTRWGRNTSTRYRSTASFSRSSGRQWRVGIAS